MRGRKTGKERFLIFVFYILLLQEPLSSRMAVFGYTDEVFALLGIALLFLQVLRTGKLRMKRTTARMIPAFLVFLGAGLAGNYLYGYQPMAAVLTDLYTNMKFFLAVISGQMLLRRCRREVLVRPARFAAAVFFLLLLADQLLHVFSSPESRYGLRVSRLFYGHTTYLAGAAVFLLSILTAFYQKRNRKYIVMCLTVLFFTLRGKAIAGVAVYCLIACLVLRRGKRLKLWHVAVIVLAVYAVAGEQFAYYYIDLRGQSARSVLTQTAFQILRDYFPIGTGFGTYASSVAAEYYSPVYVKYGFLSVYELGGGGAGFFNDTFWPIILGQTGAIGTLGYLTVLLLLYQRIGRLRRISIPGYGTGIFIFAYLIISSTSEPAFNNAIAIPLAMMLGYLLTLEKPPEREEGI